MRHPQVSTDGKEFTSPPRSVTMPALKVWDLLPAPTRCAHLTCHQNENKHV